MSDRNTTALPGRDPTAPQRNRKHLHTPRRVGWPELSPEQILAWADDHHARTGTWPNINSGQVLANPREKWKALDHALKDGHRGLERGSSLARLLADRRGVRNRLLPPPLTVAQILQWADAFHEQHGSWPTSSSGPIDSAPAESWQAVDVALNKGRRGLPAGSSLAQLLALTRKARSRRPAPRLTLERILGWADAHHARTKAWPTTESGAVVDATGETWNGIHRALCDGTRGLAGGTTLAQLLAEHRPKRHRKRQPHHTVEQIREWMHAHRTRYGRWPTGYSGPVDEAPGETWGGVDAALRQGSRGLLGGSSLLKLRPE